MPTLLFYSVLDMIRTEGGGDTSSLVAMADGGILTGGAGGANGHPDYVQFVEG